MNAEEFSRSACDIGWSLLLLSILYQLHFSMKYKTEYNSHYNWYPAESQLSDFMQHWLIIQLEEWINKYKIKISVHKFKYHHWNMFCLNNVKNNKNVHEKKKKKNGWKSNSQAFRSIFSLFSSIFLFCSFLE